MKVTDAQRSWMRQVALRHGLCLSTIGDWVRTWQCQICDTDISGFRQACLDHDHATGRPRGVICRRCNLGLSYLDSAEWMDRARRYIERSIIVAPRRQRPAPMPPSTLPPRVATAPPSDINQMDGIRPMGPDKHGRERWQVRVSTGPQEKEGRTVYGEITRVVRGSRSAAELERRILLKEVRSGKTPQAI